jgi:hypothetical protein
MRMEESEDAFQLELVVVLLGWGGIDNAGKELVHKLT